MTENEISYKVRGCIFKVYFDLGPGLLESAYMKAMASELNRIGLSFKTQVSLPLIYNEEKTPNAFRLDFLVEEKVIVEIKSVEILLPVHHKQLITYLQISGKKLGLLVNFNSSKIINGIFRKVNGL